MARRRKLVDRYPGPDAVWLFVKRNRVTIGIVVCGLLALGLVWVFANFWRGGCGGTEADRTVVADLNRDPLLTAVPPDATQIEASTKYRGCGRPVTQTGRRPPPVTRPVAVELVMEYRLANDMTAVELHNHYVNAVGLAGWRLTHSEETSLAYCRQVRDYRVVSTMTVDGTSLRIATAVWTDGADCAAEVAIRG